MTEIAVVDTYSLLCVTSCRHYNVAVVVEVVVKIRQDTETSAKPASASERVLASTSALSFTTIGYGKAAERRREAFENVGDESHVTAVISWGVVLVFGPSGGRKPASLLRGSRRGSLFRRERDVKPDDCEEDEKGMDELRSKFGRYSGQYGDVVVKGKAAKHCGNRETTSGDRQARAKLCCDFTSSLPRHAPGLGDALGACDRLPESAGMEEWPAEGLGTTIYGGRGGAMELRYCGSCSGEAAEVMALQRHPFDFKRAHQ